MSLVFGRANGSEFRVAACIPRWELDVSFRVCTAAGKLPFVGWVRDGIFSGPGSWHLGILGTAWGPVGFAAVSRLMRCSEMADEALQCWSTGADNGEVDFNDGGEDHDANDF